MDGISVLDVSSAVAGPWLSSQLSDLGADVVLVERVDVPDSMRLSGPTTGDQSGAWVSLHKNKRAVALDLTDERIRAAMHALVADTDVFVQNFRPGVAERLGLGYDDLSVINPDLIYVSITGFGPTGPEAQRPTYDPIIQAVSGLVECQHGDLVKTIVVDKVTAQTGAIATVAALFARERGTGGQKVELSLLDSMFNWAWFDLYWNHSMPDADPVPTYPEWYVPYDTADGQITTVWTTWRQYKAAAVAVGREDLVDDPRFATRDSRLRNSAAQREEFAAALARLTTDDAIAALSSADVPCARVATRDEAVHNQQLAHNGTIVDMDNPNGGRTRVARPPARFSKTPTGVERHAPGWGEHTDEVLSAAGLTANAIDALREAGRIR